MGAPFGPGRTADRSPVNPYASAAFVLGVLAVPFFFLGVFGGLALGFGIAARRQPADLRGGRMADLGITLGALSLAGFLLTVVVTLAHRPLPRIRLATAAVGTCVDERSPARTVHRSPCARPHQSEVIAVFQDAETDPPQEVEGLQRVELRCEAEFEAYVGDVASHVPLDVHELVPTASGWARGDRTVVCVAATGDAHQLVGTVRDLARKRLPGSLGAG